VTTDISTKRLRNPLNQASLSHIAPLFLLQPFKSFTFGFAELAILGIIVSIIVVIALVIIESCR
jgi:hypothetical protein